MKREAVRLQQSSFYAFTKATRFINVLEMVLPEQERDGQPARARR
jgi:hypothetical protein